MPWPGLVPKTNVTNPISFHIAINNYITSIWLTVTWHAKSGATSENKFHIVPYSISISQVTITSYPFTKSPPHASAGQSCEIKHCEEWRRIAKTCEDLRRCFRYSTTEACKLSVSAVSSPFISPLVRGTICRVFMLMNLDEFGWIVRWWIGTDG